MRLGSGQILGRRASQQDYFATLERNGVTVLLLADGIGGLDEGDVASELAVKAFKRSVERTGLADATGALDAALERANEAVARASEALSGARGMGTTLVALVVGERSVHWLSVGDSLVLRVRSGTVSRLNRQHTRMVQLRDKVRRGELSPAAAAADPQRDSITSALQGGPIPEVDRGEQARWDGDGFALASDGVLSIGFAALQQALVGKGPPQAGVDALLERIEAADEPGQDNTTVIVAMPGEDPPPVAAAQPRSRRPSRRRLAVAAAALLLLVPALLWTVLERRAPEPERRTGASGIEPPDGTIGTASVGGSEGAPMPAAARDESRGVDYSKDPPPPEPAEPPEALSTAPGRLPAGPR